MGEFLGTRVLTACLFERDIFSAIKKSSRFLGKRHASNATTISRVWKHRRPLTSTYIPPGDESEVYAPSSR